SPSGVRKQFPCASGSDQVVEPCRFRRNDAAPERRQLVIPPAFVVELRCGAAPGFLNQAAFNQLLDRSVESPRPDIAMRTSGGEVLLDPIGISVRFGERGAT